jgi:hypothetical protein
MLKTEKLRIILSDVKRKATDLDTQPTTTQQSDVCAQKCQVAD